jgi:hypothetical protein
VSPCKANINEWRSGHALPLAQRAPARLDQRDQVRQPPQRLRCLPAESQAIDLSPMALKRAIEKKTAKAEPEAKAS